LIKRVVGLPGERVHIDQGQLFINGRRTEPPPDIAATINHNTHVASIEDTLARLLIGWAKFKRIPVDLPPHPPEEHTQLRADLEALHAQVRDRDLAKIPWPQSQQLVAAVGPTTRTIARQWYEEKLFRLGPAQYGISLLDEFVVVSPGQYFCLGDNGPESFDSRMFGWVPHENLIGRAFAIVTPPRRMRDLSGFTSTPRGRLILYASLGLVIAWQLIPGYLGFSWRLRGALPNLGLRRGDRVLVDRVVYGIRIPFLTHRFFWWRRPRPGEVVCFRMSRRNSLDLSLGEVREVKSSPRMRLVVTGPPEAAAGGQSLYVLSASDVLGRARLVWRPRRRRQIVRARDAAVESAAVNEID
jgi:signal peptidase I